MEVRVHNILKSTKAEGPDTRYCIWFQGCSKRCKGCFNQAAQSFTQGKLVNCDEILKDILKQNNIEGVTFLGGEPFEQYDALLYLSKKINSYNLGIVCFTGKHFSEIEKKYSEILPYIDLLIDGEYIEEKKDFSRPWVGSTNQNYYFLSNRYDKKILKKYKNSFEINIKKDGTCFINGMGDIEKLLKNLNMAFFH